MKRRRMVIAVETKEVMVLKRTTASRQWCEGCRAEVMMVWAEEAALVAGVTARAIYCWAEAALIHFTETSEGLLLICTDSLLEKEL